MTTEEQQKIEKAFKFSVGLRGQYIIAQALHHAIKVMEHVPSPHTEVSDINDTKYLRDTLYNTFPDTFFTDNSTGKHWQYLTDVVASDGCTHVVADCEIDTTCECGQVFID